MNFGASRLGFWFNSSPFTLNWSTSQTGINPACGVGGWQISNQGLLVRYIIQDSENCGGCNPSIQTGTATATITTGTSSYKFFYELSGIAEYQNANYELMRLYIKPSLSPTTTLLVSASGKEEGLGCVSGEAQQTVLVPPPYTLNASTTYIFSLDFTTNDNLYHVGCFYECALRFQRI